MSTASAVSSPTHDRPTHDHAAHDHTTRAVGVVGFASIALIHVLDLPGKIHETPYLAAAYIVLIFGMLWASALLMRGDARRGWLLGGGLALATLVGYAINRTIGMPAATGDIGNWLEPIGLASLFVEACVAALAGWALSQSR